MSNSPLLQPQLEIFDPVAFNTTKYLLLTDAATPAFRFLFFGLSSDEYKNNIHVARGCLSLDGLITIL